MIRLRSWGAGAMLALAPLSVLAFGPVTARRMTDVSLRLAPPALRAVLLSNRAQLDRGVADALAASGAMTRAEVLREAQQEYDAIPLLPGSQTPFEVIARHFGRLAGFIFSANDPLAWGRDARSAGVRADYFRYVERKLPLMVFTFDGYGKPSLGPDIGAYLADRAGAAGRYESAVLFCYFPGGKRVSSDTFDDRSNAFGVAQLTLSHAASDTAKAWLNLWRAMDGDLSATPYYRGEGGAAGVRQGAEGRAPGR